MKTGRAEYDSRTRTLAGTVPLVMGTKLSALIVGAEENTARSAWSRSVSLAGALESMLNRFDASSEVSLLNSGCDSGPRPVSSALAEILLACKAYRDRTSGLFDITKGGGSYTVSRGSADMHGTTADFGGIAKGWFLRGCRQILQDAGIKDAFICFGNSSILAMGHHPYGDCWKVSVVDPFSGKALTERDLRDISMSVSGNRPGYESHIIDPSTHKGIPGRKVTVALAPDPADAEVLSTVAMLATGEELETITLRFDEADVKTYNDGL